MENLYRSMRFTGYDVNGGFAEYVTVPENFAFKVPEKFDAIHAAPLFCTGIMGYGALRLSWIKKRQHYCDIRLRRIMAHNGANR